MLRKWIFLLLTITAIIKVHGLVDWSPRRNQYNRIRKVEKILLSLAFRNTLALK